RSCAARATSSSPARGLIRAPFVTLRDLLAPPPRVRSGSPGRGRRLRRIIPAAVLAWAVTGCGTGTTQSPGGPAGQGALGGTRLAPYVDMGLRPAPDLVKGASGGIRIFNLAFITATSGSCQASWGGGTAYDDASIEQRVRALRGAGGDARLSFGGARSRELAQ